MRLLVRTGGIFKDTQNPVLPPGRVSPQFSRTIRGTPKR